MEDETIDVQCSCPYCGETVVFRQETVRKSTLSRIPERIPEQWSDCLYIPGSECKRPLEDCAGCGLRYIARSIC